MAPDSPKHCAQAILRTPGALAEVQVMGVSAGHDLSSQRIHVFHAVSGLPRKTRGRQDAELTF